MAYTGQAVFGGTTDPVTGSWNNATALNAVVVSSDITGYGVVAASFVISGTITQGTAIFEVSDDGGTTWWSIAGLQTGNSLQATSFALTGSSASFEFATGAYNLFRVRLNPVILGSGSVVVRLTAEAFPFTNSVAVAGTVNVSITGTNVVSVSGTVAATQSGTWTVQQGGAPWSQNLTQLNGVALGSPSNFGTSPGAISVSGHNASIFAGTTGLTATGTSLNVNITGGSSAGTQYTGAPAVAAGSLVSNLQSGYDGTNVRPLLSSSTGQLHVITDSGSTTVVTGTVTVSGTVTANIGTTGGLALDATLTGGTQKTKIVDSGGTNVATVSATGAVKVDGSAVTQPVSGTVAVSSVGGTVTVAGTVATTQSGTWTVQQGTPPWSQNLTQINGSAAVTAATGVLKVGVVGNAGAAFDTAATQNQAMPANMVIIGGEFNTTPTTITTGNASPLQVDAVGSVKTTNPNRTVAISLTAVAQTAQISLEGATSVGFNISNIGTGGTLVCEGSIDGVNWFGMDVWSEFLETWIINPATVSTTGNWWAEPLGAMAFFRVRVTALTSGTITGTLLANQFYMGTFEYQAADGTTFPNNLVAVGGKGLDGNVHGITVDSGGNLQVSITPAVSNTFFTFGDVTTSVIAKAAVRRTAYNEQAVNAIRSISSSSANDSSAGTGARTVQINYMTTAGVKGSEIVTLNGTTAVATANSFCYVESIVVQTVGSTGSNVGTLTLFVNNAGGGGTIGTIAPTDNRTFWCHHYVAAGKTLRVTGVSVGHNGTTVGSGGVYILAAINVPVANQPEEQISDFIRLYGQSSTISRLYNSPIIVTGPARIIQYVTPESASSIIYRGSFDYFES